MCVAGSVGDTHEFLSESSCFPPQTWSWGAGRGQLEHFFPPPGKSTPVFYHLWVLFASLSSAHRGSAGSHQRDGLSHSPPPSRKTVDPVGGGRGVTSAAMGAMLVVMRVGGRPAGCRESRHSISVPFTWGRELGGAALTPWFSTSGKPQLVRLAKKRGRLCAWCVRVQSPGTLCGCGNPNKKPGHGPSGEGSGPRSL